MSKHAVGLPDIVLSTSFIGLVLSLAGWALLEAWLIAVQASWRGHALASAAGLGLVLHSARPLLRFRPSAGDPADSTADRPRGRSGGDAGPVLFLLATGCLLGLSALGGSTLALLAVAACLSFFPWWRLALCRHSSMTAGSIMLAAATATVSTGWEAASLMFLPFAGWVFWMCAAMALLVRARKAKRAACAVSPLPHPPEAPSLHQVPTCNESLEPQ